MGNRGKLHEGDEIVRSWKEDAWVTCVLDETFQKRRPFSPRTYSELFFLDEATAFAAGHRPCRRCQYACHEQFNVAWAAANRSVPPGSRLPIAEIDAALHAERMTPDETKRTYTATLSDLPFGVFFEHEGAAYLVGPTGPLVWSFDGYARGAVLGPSTRVEVLTPASTVRAFRGGFQPFVHASAEAL